MDQQALTMVRLREGRTTQARDVLSGTLDFVVSAGNPEVLAVALELAGCIAAELGEPLHAARLAGAAEMVRQAAGMPRVDFDAALLERFLGPARAIAGREEWDAELAAGRALSQQQAVTLLLAFSGLRPCRARPPARHDRDQRRRPESSLRAARPRRRSCNRSARGA
jgi:hypothetical protein